MDPVEPWNRENLEKTPQEWSEAGQKSRGQAGLFTAGLHPVAKASNRVVTGMPINWPDHQVYFSLKIRRRSG